MHTTTNYLLINKAVADIITLLWSPAVYAIALAKIHPSGLAGDTLCKFFTGNEIVDVGTSVSIINLTFLAIERYNALIKPFKYRVRLTMENIPYAVAVMWTLAILVCVPGFIQFKYDESKQSCVGPWGLDMDVSMAVFALCMVVIFFTKSLSHCKLLLLPDCPRVVLQQHCLRPSIYKRARQALKTETRQTVCYYNCSIFYLPHSLCGFYDLCFLEEDFRSHKSGRIFNLCNISSPCFFVTDKSMHQPDILRISEFQLQTRL